jgi:23S rRNA (pseudouridine1915-N3)-methyltransferase
MKFQFWSVGKENESYVDEGIQLFTKRINNYYPATWNIISSPKNASKMEETELKNAEGDILLGYLKKDDYLILLDERGKQLNCEKLAIKIQELANESRKNIIFLIGGAYGVSKEVIKRADMIWSLSELVFPHQIVRMMLSEQIYRACTIIRNEKYHHK